MKLTKVAKRRRIRQRIRKKIQGSNKRPRISIFRSNQQIYAQIIDDNKGHTLISASSKEDEISAFGNKTEQAIKVGELLAKKAKEAGIEIVIFDRGGYLYHGRVKALAEGARKGGLKF